MNTEIINRNLEKSISGMLLEFFNKQIPSEKLVIGISERQDLAFAEHMVIVLLTHAQIRMFLKIHFHMEMAKKFAAARQKKKTWQDIKDRAAIDFMKELCNVLGGRLKRKISHLDLELGQSIPLDLEGFSEIFFRDVNWSSQTLIFDIANAHLQMQISVQYEITGQDAMTKLAGFTQGSTVEEEDIEFL